MKRNPKIRLYFHSETLARDIANKIMQVGEIKYIKTMHKTRRTCNAIQFIQLLSSRRTYRQLETVQ